MRKRRTLPPQERLKELLRYDPTTGHLTWKARKGSAAADRIAGTDNLTGHDVVRVDGVLYLAHRVIWKIQTGCEPPDYIDHRDLNGRNNKWENLRAATNGTNMMNANASKQNKSGVKGVFWYRTRQKWKAEINADGCRRHVGYFGSLDAAKLAMAEMRQKLHGEFAR